MPELRQTVCHSLTCNIHQVYFHILVYVLVLVMCVFLYLYLHIIVQCSLCLCLHDTYNTSIKINTCEVVPDAGFFQTNCKYTVLSSDAQVCAELMYLMQFQKLIVLLTQQVKVPEQVHVEKYRQMFRHLHKYLQDK